MSGVNVDHEDAMDVMERMFGPIIKPETAEEGRDWFDNFSEAVDAAKLLNSESPMSHFWTIIEADNEDALYVDEGNRLVNRMHMWLVTTRPHNFDGNIFLWHRYENSEEAD